MKALAFFTELYKKEYLNSLSDKELYELALEDERIIIFDDLQTLQTDLNDRCFSLEKYYIYFVKWN